MLFCIRELFSDDTCDDIAHPVMISHLFMLVPRYSLSTSLIYESLFIFLLLYLCILQHGYLITHIAFAAFTSLFLFNIKIKIRFSLNQQKTCGIHIVCLQVKTKKQASPFREAQNDPAYHSPNGKMYVVCRFETSPLLRFRRPANSCKFLRVFHSKTRLLYVLLVYLSMFFMAFFHRFF